MRTTTWAMVAVLMLASHAQAEDVYAEASNGAGGRIVLTQQQTERCKPLLAMYAYNGAGKLVEGCWTYMQGMVHVVYADGERRVYAPNSFEVKGGNKGQQRQNY